MIRIAEGSYDSRLANDGVVVPGQASGVLGSDPLDHVLHPVAIPALEAGHSKEIALARWSEAVNIIFRHWTLLLRFVVLLRRQGEVNSLPRWRDLLLLDDVIEPVYGDQTLALA